MSVEPGTICPTCERRVNHPKKSTSPVTTVKSFRLPTDGAEDFERDFLRSCLVVGITSELKFPIYKFLDFVIDVILSDEEKWAGAYTDVGVGRGVGERSVVA